MKPRPIDNGPAAGCPRKLNGNTLPGADCSICGTPGAIPSPTPMRTTAPMTGRLTRVKESSAERRGLISGSSLHQRQAFRRTGFDSMMSPVTCSNGCKIGTRRITTPYLPALTHRAPHQAHRRFSGAGPGRADPPGWRSIDASGTIHRQGVSMSASAVR